ncbi:MAG TPA: flagellar basal body P-ring protein FlgI [Thermoguttaceae bacterium]|nr:flagellar basal body P-ring protein FlgI [Thermoguttaceae bacterium]
MKSRSANRLAAAAITFALWASGVPAGAQTTLESICRVKGQEEITLRGLGFVVGLEGTGDDGKFLPTVRSLAQAMELMGQPLGENGLTELKDAANVALVIVTATVPGTGAREGDRLDCKVSSMGKAESLAGGRLFLTPLLSPDKSDRRIYGFAEGDISLDNPALTRTGRIDGGCRLEADFPNPFVQDGRITLVLDRNHASFQIAQDVAELINNEFSFQNLNMPLALAVNQANVSVTIPPQYRDVPVEFVSEVLRLPIVDPRTAARVVINERAGSIVISGDVEIGAAVVAHKNVVIRTGNATGAGQFVPIDPGQTAKPKLEALLEALNAIQVPTEDIIDVIKGLAADGQLHGQLVFE